MSQILARLFSSGLRRCVIAVPPNYLQGTSLEYLSKSWLKSYVSENLTGVAKRIAGIRCVKLQHDCNQRRPTKVSTRLLKLESARKKDRNRGQTNPETSTELSSGSGSKEVGMDLSKPRFSHSSVNGFTTARGKAQGQTSYSWNGFVGTRYLHSAVSDDESEDSDEYTLEKEEATKSKSRVLVEAKKRRKLPMEEAVSEDERHATSQQKRRPNAVKATSAKSGVRPSGLGISAKRRMTSLQEESSESDFEGDMPARSTGSRRKTVAKEDSSESELEIFEDRRNVGRTRKQKPKLKEDQLKPSYEAGFEGKSVLKGDHLDFDSESDHEDTEDVDSSTSHLTQTRFDKFKISPLSIKALHSVLKYERMTEVQEATFPVILEGQDVLAKARTGTGKTIAFLLPAIEMILKASKGVVQNPIYVLIVCPTRELAQQAAAEAHVLLTFHKNLGAQVVFGGNPIRIEQMNLCNKPCQILVGTPGRLVDHIQRTRELTSQLKNVKLFVLDEADHMLDMGFRDSLSKIMQALPSQRQTLLFSATIPQEVHSMARIALKTDHMFIDTVGKNSQDTHAKVKQQCIIVPLKKQLTVVYSMLKAHMKADPSYKVLVFCTTARVTAFMSKLFKDLGLNSREIHSRKDQKYRTRVSDEFRHSKGGIVLFTSDVSARGVDYPNVTLVVQVGAPSEFEQYIHRLGRTGRAGKKGEGLLVLAPWENFFVQKLQKLPVTMLPAPKLSSEVEDEILSTVSDIDPDIRSKAYQAWIGYYKSLKGISLDKATLVHYANEFSFSMGFEQPPLLSRGLVAKMSLSGVPGIRITR